MFSYQAKINDLGSPAEGFIFPLDEHRMVTNIDARENAQANYDHAILKYKCHDVDEATGQVTTPPCLSVMAQTHKKSTAARFLQDYIGKVLTLALNFKQKGYNIQN